MGPEATVVTDPPPVLFFFHRTVYTTKARRAAGASMDLEIGKSGKDIAGRTQ